MFRSPVFSILLAIALGASAFRAYQVSRQVADLTSQNQDLEARNENLQSELIQAHLKTETALLGQQSNVEQLEAKIAAQKDVLAQAELRLQRQHGEGEGEGVGEGEGEGEGGNHLGSLRDKLHEEEQVIADLNQQLKDLHGHESQLRTQDKFYQQQAGSSQRQNDQDLKAQITGQQQQLQQLDSQLKHFQVNPWDSDSTDQYHALQAQVDALKSNIQQLKQQRAESGAQWGYQKAQTHDQNQQNLADLKNSEDELQSQLQREKAAQASLQKDIQSGVQTQHSQSALLESAQADYDNQKARLQDLENQLQAAQAKVQRIGGK